LLETPKAIIYHSGMREHKCEGLKKIRMNIISILKYLIWNLLMNGQSAANIVSDNNKVQRLDKVR
jgi:hypothetical protein